MPLAEAAPYWITRLVFQRALAFVYFIGFLIVLNQYRGLVGERGLLPLKHFLKRVDFWDAPSVFWLGSSDTTLMIAGGVGLVLSIFALLGFSEAFTGALGTAVSMAVWTALWILYLSFVNVGQEFYGFGWEMMLCEVGFLAIFLGPSRSGPSVIPMILLRWVLFRLMFGAGMIKIRGDSCWRDLTCMTFHYETQPMPGPLSWFFHQMPLWMHKGAVLVNHFVELVVPFGLFGPRSVRHAAGLITIAFQATLILSGNLSWLNYLTIVIAIACFDDGFFMSLGWSKPEILVSGGIPQPVIWALAAGVAFLSIKPARNLLARDQAMNASFDSLHLVNTYGAFGSVTRTRDEIVIEGSLDGEHWQEYEFRGKPGDPSRLPSLVAPYQLHLDWQMWFAAMGPYYQSPWTLNLVAKLLQNEPVVTSLLKKNPFEEKPPRLIRARLYEYHFTKPGESGWWERKLVGEYLPPLSLDSPQFHEILRRQGWLEDPAS